MLSLFLSIASVPLNHHHAKCMQEIQISKQANIYAQRHNKMHTAYKCMQHKQNKFVFMTHVCTNLFKPV